MPVAKGEVFLKYCPMCVEEDKKKYGERYFHVEHQFDKIKICPHHCCKLKNTNIKNTGLNASVFKPLEMCEISKEVEVVDPNSIDVRFTKYLYEFYKYNFSLSVFLLYPYLSLLTAFYTTFFPVRYHYSTKTENFK